MREHECLERCAEALRAALFSANIELPEEQTELLACHLALVIRKNETVNLTRITSAEEGAYLHVVDSLLLRGAFDAAPSGSFVDVGTGAGFPGIPLAVVTGRKALLLDSVGKKVAAVDEFLRELGLDGCVEARQERVEDLGRTQRAQCAVVTARAVAQANVLVEYAAPLLRKGGRLVMAKARPSEEEVLAAKRAARLCGMRFVSRETFELPGERGHREVLSYEKVGKPSLRLPRAVGMAKRSPLGVEGSA
ncbi:MAG: 16S rRNA (guanine(527)-N(7))-methyltransferase RsmG [Atopobiaceae bacterium]|nr:16S rRNA (guanine(527)-N(7))-methyltransferase RsmG [Atopobiaceae bacterium]